MQNVLASLSDYKILFSMHAVDIISLIVTAVNYMKKTYNVSPRE
jgi:hypothetical protein